VRRESAVSRSPVRDSGLSVPMTATLAGPAAPTLPGRLVTICSLLALLSTAAVVLVAALGSPLKDDVAWLLYVAGQWLGGQRLYIDLVEINPPLIVWLSAIPAWLADWAGLAPKSVALPLFGVCILGASWWTACLLRDASPLFRDRFAVFALIGTVLLGVAGPELGQREHLLIAAWLPYLCLLARSLGGDRVRLGPLVAAGVLAGLGCALKPRYLLVFAALEMLALTRGLRPWRPAVLAGAATLASYAAAIMLLYPAYLERAVPLGIALYSATDVPFSFMLYDNVSVMLGEAAVLLLWWPGRRTREGNLVLVLGVFAIASTLVCFIDGKNWFYHRLPATIATVLALLCWVASALARSAPERRRLGVQLLVALAALTTFGIAAAGRLRPEVELACSPELSTEARLEKLIRRERAKTYVAFSEWIALGFPVVNNTGVVWASRFDSMWALKGELWRARFDPDAHKEWPVRRWVARDFVAGCPDLAVVDTRESLNYIAVLSVSDPAFASAWSQYRQIAAFDGLRVYKHQGSVHCSRRPRMAEAKMTPDASPFLP
jgi:hypothetical protein